MKVKIFDEEHELDLENKINEFLSKDIIFYDIKYQVSAFKEEEEQIYIFSAMIVYE